MTKYINRQLKTELEDALITNSQIKDAYGVPDQLKRFLEQIKPGEDD